jgi:hypothetical protein
MAVAQLLRDLGSGTWMIPCAGGKGIGSRFLVMIDEDQVSATRDAAKELCDSFSDIVELRSSRHPGIALVRPDGYIAHSVQHGDSVAALSSIRSLLERQTKPVNTNAAR